MSYPDFGLTSMTIQYITSCSNVPDSNGAVLMRFPALLTLISLISMSTPSVKLITFASLMFFPYVIPVTYALILCILVSAAPSVVAPSTIAISGIIPVIMTMLRNIAINLLSLLLINIPPIY